MCGLGGIINAEELQAHGTVEALAKAVSHRGPDSTGVALYDREFRRTESTGTHALFFNRLAIIDLDPRSNQPFENERYVLVFNGEIYNFKELKTELTGKGIRFNTSSDTEVLFFALQHWGVDALSRLNGMFAFCWIDKHQRKFLVARDRVGVKPLYFRIEGKSLLFASELHSVARLSKERPTVSQTAIENYLRLQYVPTPKTIIEGISKLPPGHFIAGSLADLETQQSLQPVAYWDGYDPIRRNNPKQDLEELLVESIRDQMESDVPLGLFLSAGVDSSLLTAVINRHFRGRPYDLFTVAFEETTHLDESRQAQEYLNGFKNPELRHHILPVSADFVASQLGQLYHYFDEPFGDHAALLNWAVSKKAREHVTVVLSGDGADEMFWGYDRYNEWQIKSAQSHRASALMPMASRLGKMLPSSRFTNTLRNMLVSDPVSIYFDILTPRLFGFLPAIEKDKELWSIKGIDRILDRKDLPAILDLKTYLADAMLYKVDRSSMACSLEVRVPYLDNRIIDFALGLPLDQKSTSEFRNKAPLKCLLRDLAPHYDFNHPKRGLGFPLKTWMQSGWKEMIQDMISKKNLEDVGLQPAIGLKMVQEFYSGKMKSPTEIWYLFNLLLWHQNFKKIISTK